MDYIPGQILMSASLDTVLETLGKAHAELHKIDPTNLIDSFIEAGVSDYVYGLDSRFNNLRERAKKQPWIQGGVKWLLDHRPPEPDQASVCHGDFHPLNILVENEMVAGVLDWAGFVVADPIFDVANTLVLITIPVKHLIDLPDEVSAFDWKYLWGLEITDPGFDYAVLCEFRARLVTGDAISLWLDRMIEVLKAQGILKSRQSQRTDSTHILTAVRDLSRLELVGKTMLQVLNSLAVVHPAWLKTIVPGEWQARYVTRWEDAQLPKSKTKRIELGEQVGCDGGEPGTFPYPVKTSPQPFCSRKFTPILFISDSINTKSYFNHKFEPTL